MDKLELQETGTIIAECLLLGDCQISRCAVRQSAIEGGADALIRRENGRSRPTEAVEKSAKPGQFTLLLRAPTTVSAEALYQLAKTAFAPCSARPESSPLLPQVLAVVQATRVDQPWFA